MTAALCLLRLSRCGCVLQNQLRRDLPQLNTMKIFQSDFDLCLTGADCRFLETNAHSFGSGSRCCSRSSCNISIACPPVIFSCTQRNTVWLLSDDMTLPGVTFLYHF